MPTKYFLYARKSTEGEDKQKMSIEAQLAELAELAKRENIEITEIFTEQKSAKQPGREIFNKMIEKIYASKEPVGIISWHPFMSTSLIHTKYILFSGCLKQNLTALRGRIGEAATHH